MDLRNRSLAFSKGSDTFSPEHPKLARLPKQAFPIKLSETPGGFRSFAPSVGAHANEVLASVGYSADAIAALRSAGVV